MSDYLPKTLREELAAALVTRKHKRARRAVHLDDTAYAVLEMSDRGLAVDARTTPPLRGLIDIYEGPAHLYQALIVASERDGDLMRYDFKRNTAALKQPPLDFEETRPRPTGLLPRN